MMNFVIFLPASMSLTYFWNIGSFLGMSLVIQVLTGLFLYMNYNSIDCYSVIQYIMIEVNYGWLFKIIHSNNASIIFFFLYVHLFKNLAISGYRLILVWISGIIMMFLIMGAAFSGYALVGSQMSFWAVMVITSLMSVIPMIGDKFLYFFWGGFMLNWTTFQTLLMVHFILPFLVLGIMMSHLIFLHLTGSTDMIGGHTGMMKITFYPFYWFKDLVNLVVYFIFFILLLIFPYMLSEPELFEEPNFLNSPLHIMPEWYFLTQYAILRSVPSKVFGVIMMVLSIMFFFLYSFICSFFSPKLLNYNWLFSEELMMWFFWLGFLGSVPIIQPFIIITQFSVFIYFFIQCLFFFFNFMMSYCFFMEG